jgi:hypothetical protein
MSCASCSWVSTAVHALASELVPMNLSIIVNNSVVRMSSSTCTLARPRGFELEFSPFRGSSINTETQLNVCGSPCPRTYDVVGFPRPVVPVPTFPVNALIRHWVCGAQGAAGAAGTSTVGFFEKKPTGTSMKPTRWTGTTGQSSGRGT